MISILISSESRYPVDRKKIRETATNLIKKTGLEDVEVSVTVVGSRKITQLNRNYRKIDKVANVLSFPLEQARGPDGVLRLGDIIICYPMAREQAGQEEKLVDEKIKELLEHGLKHLLGEHNEGNR